MKFGTRQLHTWLGVGFGGLFALIAVTGVLLHFEDYLKPSPVEVPASARGRARLTLDALVDRAAERLGGRPQHIMLPDGPDAPVMLQRGLDQVYFSQNGTFLEARSERHSWRFIVMSIHGGGLGRRPGEWVMTIAGLALLASFITGLGIWPRYLKLRRSRAASRRPGG